VGDFRARSDGHGKTVFPSCSARKTDPMNNHLRLRGERGGKTAAADAFIEAPQARAAGVLA
jgi:hypothetical protein